MWYVKSYGGSPRFWIQFPLQVIPANTAIRWYLMGFKGSWMWRWQDTASVTSKWLHSLQMGNVLRKWTCNSLGFKFKKRESTFSLYNICVHVLSSQSLLVLSAFLRQDSFYNFTKIYYFFFFRERTFLYHSSQNLLDVQSVRGDLTFSVALSVKYSLSYSKCDFKSHLLIIQSQIYFFPRLLFVSFCPMKSHPSAEMQHGQKWSKLGVIHIVVFNPRLQ